MISELRALVHEHKFFSVIVVMTIATIAFAFVPLFGYQLDASTATLLGSFLGAFVAVAGAAWYTHAERLNSDKEIALALLILITPAMRKTEDLAHEANGCRMGKILPSLVQKHANDARGVINAAVADIHEIKAHITNFGAANISGVLNLHRKLKRLDVAVAVISQETLNDMTPSVFAIRDVEAQLEATRESASWLRKIR